MGKVKQKLLIVFLIVIAIVIGYQAYVIGHGYARTASQVPFWSGGVRIYCREHNNSFRYGNGTTGYSYACVGEVNLSKRNAYDFAYYVSRAGFSAGAGASDLVQKIIWEHSGASAGSVILNAGSNFYNWLGSGEDFSNLFPESGSSHGGDSSESANNSNSITLSDMRGDWTMKPVENNPEYFFSSYQANTNGIENADKIESLKNGGDSDISDNFVAQEYNDFLDESGNYRGTIEKNWGKDLKTFSATIENKGKEIGIDWTSIDANKKETLIANMLELSGKQPNGYKHTYSNIDRINTLLSSAELDKAEGLIASDLNTAKKEILQDYNQKINNLASSEKTEQERVNEIKKIEAEKDKKISDKIDSLAAMYDNNVKELLKMRLYLKETTFTNDLEGHQYDSAEEKALKNYKKEMVINYIQQALTKIDSKTYSSGADKTKTDATGIVNQVIKEQKAIDILEKTINELEANKKAEAENAEQRAFNEEKAKLTDKFNKDKKFEKEKEALKNAKQKIENTENKDYTYDEYFKDIISNINNYTEVEKDGQTVKNYDQSVLKAIYPELSDEELSILADDLAYKIIEEARIEKEESNIITDISFEEFKYLFELIKLYQYFEQTAKNGNYIAQNAANGDADSIAPILRHLNEYWSDGVSTEWRSHKVTVTNSGNKFTVSVNNNKEQTLEKSQIIELKQEKNKYGEDVVICTTNVNNGAPNDPNNVGATIWAFADEVKINADGSVTTIPVNGGYGKFYYEDNRLAIVSFFDRLLCFDNAGGASIGNSKDDIDILKFYAECFNDNTDGFKKLCNEIRKHYPNLANALEKMPKVGQISSAKSYINSLYHTYEVEKIDKVIEASTQTVSPEQYYIFNANQISPLEYNISCDLSKAARIFQWLMTMNSEGMTNMESIASRFKVDDSLKKVSIDTDGENGQKYIIGPFKMEYASIRLNGEQILGVNDFKVNLSIMDKDGKVHKVQISEGADKDQYKIIRSSTRKIGNLNLPTSGTEFFIELDKDVKTAVASKNNIQLADGDNRLSSNDNFSFKVSYKYLSAINAIVHLLRDCTGPNDAANPIGADSQWNSGHPQRLIAITYGDEWKTIEKETEVNPAVYDFKLRKVSQPTKKQISEKREAMEKAYESDNGKKKTFSDEEVIARIPKEYLNGAEFAAAAKYKAEDGTETYFDLETQTKNLGNDFDAIVDNVKTGKMKSYVTSSQYKGEGYILWNNIPELITVDGKSYTLECVDAQETKAPYGYKIEKEEKITIEKFGKREVEAKNIQVNSPYTLTVRKVDENGNPIKNLAIEGWFLDLGIEDAFKQASNWDFGPSNPQTVITDDNGIAKFTNNMYSDSVVFIMNEKPGKDYDYQYFRKVAVVYSAKMDDDGNVDINFVNSNVKFKYEWDEFTNDVNYQNGVFLIEDRNGNKYFGDSDEAKDRVKTKKEIKNNTLNVDVQLTNESKKPYSIIINKLDELGKVSDKLKGTTFKIWISKDGENYIDGKEIVINDKGQGKLDGITVYGDNLALYIQEVKAATGFKTRFEDRTIVYIYKADEDGTLTERENTPNTRAFGELPEGKQPVEIIKDGDGKASIINMTMTNESDNYYLKFRKIDKNGKPLQNATFTLTDKAPATAGSSLANSQTVTSDENGYMEFVGPEETEDGKVTLYLYEVSAPAGYEVKSDTSIDNPIQITYTYKAGDTTLRDLKILYNGQNIAKDLQCETKKIKLEDGTEKTVANLKNDNQYVFNFGELNDIFKLVNYEDTYNLTWKKEDTKGIALKDTEFDVTILNFDKSKIGDKGPTYEEIIDSLINNKKLPNGITFAQYEEKPSEYDSTAKKFTDPVYKDIKEKKISTTHENDGFENGTAVVDKIATYGDCYAIIKETKADGKHIMLNDYIIVHYIMNPGDIEPTWQKDLTVAKKGEDGKYIVTKYTKDDTSSKYKDKDGRTYDFVTVSESKLIIENQDLPYTLKIKKTNGISGNPVAGVTFSAKIYHTGKNDTPQIVSGKTTGNGEFSIGEIYKYTDIEDENDTITLELHETVPEGYRYSNKYFANEIVYVATYKKVGPEEKLTQLSGEIRGYLADGAGNLIKGEDGTYEYQVLSDKDIAFTISEDLENANTQNETQAYIHDVEIKNMPTYNLGGLVKVEEVNHKLIPISGITFTGEIRRGGINDNGEIVQEGQAYTPDGTKLDMNKFTIRVEEKEQIKGNIVVYGIDTCDEFVNDDGTVKTGPQTFTLVLRENATAKYKKLTHPIEIEYTCEYVNNQWNVSYKKVKYNDNEAEIKMDEQNKTSNLTALIDTDELGFYQKDTNLYVVNKPDLKPAQILLQKKDEEGNLIDGIKFTGIVEQVNTAEGENPRKLTFGQNGVSGRVTETDAIVTGKAKDVDGNDLGLTGVASIPGIDFSGDIKLTITSESWEDPTNKPALGFAEGNVEITGINISEVWNGNTGYRKVTVPTGKLTVITYDKDGKEKEKKEVDINKPEASKEFVSFSTDSNVVTFFITNPYKQYDLDGKDGAAVPFTHKIERDIQGNEKEVTKDIDFIGNIKDSDGNTLQQNVTVKFSETDNSKTENTTAGENVSGNVEVTASINAYGISGKISGENKEFYLTITEKNVIEENAEPITVIYTCVYDNVNDKFITEIVGYEYNGTRYNVKDIVDKEKDLIAGEVTGDLGRINVNDTFVPITKYDEAGNPVNGIVFKGIIRLTTPIGKDENGHPKEMGPNGEIIQEEYEFTTVTGGQYWNDQSKQMETAPDGVAVIAIPSDLNRDFTITIEEEYWGTKTEDGIWTTEKGELPDGQYPLEFAKGVFDIGGYGIKEEIKDNKKTRTLTYKGEPVKYSIEDNGKTINVENYKAVTTDEKGQIKFINDFARYNLDLPYKVLRDVQGNEYPIKEGIYFTGYITDETEYADEEQTQVVKPSKPEQDGRSTKDSEDKNKFTVGLNRDTGRIVATGIKGNLAGIDEAKTYKIVLEELSTNGSEENKGYDVEPIDPIVITYTAKYNKDNEDNPFETTTVSYEYQGKVYRNAQSIVNKDLIPNLIYVNADGSAKLINTPKTVDIPLIKKDGDGNLVNGVKFTGKIIALDEEYLDENGKPQFENGNNGTTRRKEMEFSVVTGEVPTDKDGNTFTDINGNEEYEARTGVAIIPKVPYTGRIKLVIEKEEWANEENKPAPGQTDLEFVDGQIEITFAIEKDPSGTKHISYSKGISIAVKDKDGNDITNNYMDPKNNNHNILVGTNYLDKEQKELAFGIGINNKIKTYDIPVALKVIKETDENGKVTYRQPTEEEAKMIAFTGEVTDSTGKVVQNSGNIKVEIDFTDIDNDGQNEAVIMAKGIKGSIMGENLILKLHEVSSGGLKPIPDVKVHYSYDNDNLQVISYEYNDTIQKCTDHNCKLDNFIYEDSENQFAIVNEEKENPDLVIRKVINVNGQEVGVPGIKFTIRICGEECKKECKDPTKCTCEENCTSCKEYTAVSMNDGIATFDEIKEKGNIKVVILKEELASRQEIDQEASNGETVQAYTSEELGETKLEFIKEPIVINGIKIEKKENEYAVNYDNATVAEKDKEHVRIDAIKDSKVGMQIVFTNTEATYNLPLFDNKLINEDGTLKAIFNGAEFEADIVKVEDGKEISLDDVENNSLQHFNHEDANNNKIENKGTVGINEETGAIELTGIKGTIASETTAGKAPEKYAVVLKETSSSEMPEIVIIYTCTYTVDENGKYKFTTEKEEYRWQDEDEGGNKKWHYLNPKQDIQKDQNGNIEKKQIIVDNKIKIEELKDNVVVSLINSFGDADRIKIIKKDDNGHGVEGIEFKGKVIALNDDGTVKQEDVTDENGKITGTKDIEYTFDIVTNGSGDSWIPSPSSEEIAKYEGKIKVVIEEEKWAESVTNLPYKLGFADEIIEISGLKFITDENGITEVDYPEKPEELIVEAYDKQTKQKTDKYKDKVSVNNDGTIGISIENPILDYDVDLFDAKILKYGDHYEQIKDNVTFTGRIVGYKGSDPSQIAKSYKVDVKLITESDLAAKQQGLDNGKIGKIVAIGINGEITGNDICLEVTETAIDEPVERTTIIVKYDYNPDKDGNGTPIIKEYRKWKYGIKGEAKGHVTDDTTELIGMPKDDNVKEVLGGMIYRNYSETAKNSLINKITPNPLDIQLMKIDNLGNPIKGIKFTGRIVAVDENGNTKKDEKGQEIKKEFSSLGVTGQPLAWITSNGSGIATLHLTSEEVDRFAGKIRIEIDKEEWCRIDDDKLDPNAVDPLAHDELDIIDGQIIITGKRIDVQKDKTSSLVNDGTPVVKIMKGTEDVTEKYANRVNANIADETTIAGTITNNIKKYDLDLGKKYITIDGEKIELKDGLAFKGKITHNGVTKDVKVLFGEYYYVDEYGQIQAGHTDGHIIVKGIRGNIIGNDIKLEIEEIPTIPGIIPIKIDITYNCNAVANSTEFKTTITSKNITTLDGKPVIEVDPEDNDIYDPHEDNDGVELTIRKVDENNVPVAGIKFSGEVKDAEGKAVITKFETEPTDATNGITSIVISKEDLNKAIEQYIGSETFDFNVTINKEEWADGAEATWKALPGNADRKLEFITQPVTISGYHLNETWDGNYARRSVNYEKAQCSDTHVELEQNNVTIKFANPDLTYQIPFIKTNKLLNPEVENLENLKDVAFEITVKNGDGDNNPQRFSPSSDENGRFDIAGVTKFGDSSGVVTLILKEQVSPNATAKISEDEMVITYKPVISSDNKVTLTEITVDGKPIAEIADEDGTEPNIQYIAIKQNEEEVMAFNKVNPESYKITLDKVIKVDDDVISSTESVGFKGIITTDPSLVNGTDRIKTYAEFEASLDGWKNNKDVVTFDGHTNNGKLEIPDDLLFYNKQVYVYFIEYDVPDSMNLIEEVMWASFNKKESSIESKSASVAGNVEINDSDPLNISVKVVNTAKTYKVNFKKIDAQDSSRQIDYSNAKFTVQLKELDKTNGLSTKLVETMTIAFDAEGDLIEQEKPGKCLVDATFVNNQIQIDVNKFGDLQLIVTEETAPKNYQKLDTDIVINYTANAQAEDKQKIITNVELGTELNEDIQAKIAAQANTAGDQVSIDFALPNTPDEYSMNIYKISRTNPNSTLNNIDFELLFYNSNRERFTYLERTLYVVSGGKINVNHLKEYGTNYMILHETETNGKTVRLDGYHVFEMTAEVGKNPVLTYLGMFESDKADNKDLTIAEIDSKFAEQDISKLDTSMKGYFTTNGNSVGVGNLTVGNDEPTNYTIKLLKIDEEKDPTTNENKPLAGAKFDLYLTQAQKENGEYIDNDYATETKLLQLKDQVTGTDGLITLPEIDKFSNDYGDLKLTVIETHPPKGYKADNIHRAEIIYFTKDGKNIEIKQVKLFNSEGTEIKDYQQYVNITNATDNKIAEAEIDISMSNIHKKPVSLSLKKVYYENVGNEQNRVENPLPGATFRGVVYEKGHEDEQTAFEGTTELVTVNGKQEAIANLGEFYVEGEIEIVIEEISAPDGFEKIDKTTIECYVYEENGKAKINTQDYSVSVNSAASIEEVNNIYQITITETKTIDTDLSLAGIVWEDRPIPIGEKYASDYTIKDKNGNYVATEGLYDINIDELVLSKIENEKVVEGVVVQLHKLEKKDETKPWKDSAGNWDNSNIVDKGVILETSTGDTGRFEFSELDPFAKYYITFTMIGNPRYNHDNYEPVKFLVKSEDGTQTYGSIDEAEKDARQIIDFNEDSIWARNSKAATEGAEGEANVNLNNAKTANTVRKDKDGNPNTVMDKLQLYPLYEQFTIVDSEKHENQSDTFKSYVLYEVDSNKNTLNKAEADYALSGKPEDALVFRPFEPLHNWINFGIVEKPRFNLSLSKDVDELKVQIDDKDLTYIYGKKDSDSHMYTLPINEADVANLKNMEIIYKIDVTNIGYVDGYLNSIADYYNADIMDFAEWSFDKNTWYTAKDNNPQAGSVTLEEFGGNNSLIPEQYELIIDADTNNREMHANPAKTTGRVIINFNGNAKNITIGEANKTKSIYVRYKYKDVTQTLDGKTNLFGKISNAGDSYVTLAAAEIYSSNSTGGRNDINSINGNLKTKFDNNYRQNIGDFYKNYDEGFYYWELSHRIEGNVDIDDEDTAPAMKLLIESPDNRTISGSVFEDASGISGIKDQTDSDINNMTVALWQCDQNGNIIGNSPIQTTRTKADGTYKFKGAYIESGYYRVTFTYGDEYTLLPKLYKIDDNGQSVPVYGTSESMKVGENTYWISNNVSYNGLEYESSYYEGDDITRSGDYWYKANADKTYSDAIDTHSIANPIQQGTREYADKTLNQYSGKDTTDTSNTSYYYMNNEQAELLYSYRGDINKSDVQKNIETLKDNSVTAETAKFKIDPMSTEQTQFTYEGVDETNQSIYKDTEGNIVTTGCSVDIDFGVKPREKTNLKVTKTVDNVKIYSSSGNSNVDASYDNGKAVGTAGRVQWARPTDDSGNRGYIWIQRSEEEIVGATLEITYKIDVEDRANTAGTEKVTIVDYVQDGMTYSEANNKNNNWTIQTATTRTEEGVSSIGNVNINKNIDLKDVSTVVTQDVTLNNGKAESSVYITLTKTLNSYSNTDIDAYTNYVEVIQTATTGNAKSDLNSIPGNFDPKLETTITGNLGTIYNLANSRREITAVPYDGQKVATSGREVIELENDTAKALETISITAETGENRDTTYYILAFTVLVVLATGVGIIIKKVIRRK